MSSDRPTTRLRFHGPIYLREFREALKARGFKREKPTGWQALKMRHPEHGLVIVYEQGSSYRLGLDQAVGQRIFREVFGDGW